MPSNRVITFICLMICASSIRAEDFVIANYSDDSGVEFYLEANSAAITAGDRFQYTFGIYNNSGVRIEWPHGEDRPFDALLTDAETGELAWRSSRGKWFSTMDETDIIEPGENWEKSAYENFYDRGKKAPIKPGRYFFKVMIHNLPHYEGKNPPVEMEITIVEKQVEEE